MQNKILIISQPFGCGDVIFTQTIAHEFIAGGYKIIWPVVDGLVEGLNRAYPQVTFVPQSMVNTDLMSKEFKEENGVRYLPMRFSEHLMGRQYLFHMVSKYDFLTMDWRRWKEHAMPVRDRTKEQLLRHAIGLNGEPYVLMNTKFGNDGAFTIDIRNTTGLKEVWLDFVPGFSLFDWCGIIENASVIHAVSTSTLYLFELLDLKAQQIHLYPRKPIEPDFRYTKFLMTKNYILHE